MSREQGGSSGTGMQREGGTALRGSPMRGAPLRASTAGSVATRPPGIGAGSPDRPSMLPAFMANPGLMAGAFMTDPFAFAQTMSEEMDRIFASFGGGDLPTPLGGARPGAQPDADRGRRQPETSRGAGAAAWMPQMELFQRGDEIVIRADLPGLTPDDVRIDVEDGYLTVSGERRQTREDREEGFYRTERSYGSFTRTIALPDGLDENRIAATFEHGVLEVTAPMPQPREQRGRRVEIGRGAATPGGRSGRAAGSTRPAVETPDRSRTTPA